MRGRAGGKCFIAATGSPSSACASCANGTAGGCGPTPTKITIPRETAAGIEFLARLEPAAGRTAVYYAIDRERTARPMVDPATDIPVAVPDDERLEIRALAAQRLSTTSRLAELILEDPIWCALKTAPSIPHRTTTSAA